MLTIQLSLFPQTDSVEFGALTRQATICVCVCVRQDFEDYLQTTIGFEKVDVIEPPGCDLMKKGQVGRM